MTAALSAGTANGVRTLRGQEQMTNEELKRVIRERTGLPMSLLNGKTAEENIAQARTLLEYKRDHSRAKSTAEKFGEWFNSETGETPQDGALNALAEIEEALRVADGGYPITQDGGDADVSNLPDPRSTGEQFAEWFGERTTFNPFTNESRF